MHPLLRIAIPLIAALLPVRIAAQAPEIPFTRTVLPNGLTLIVHEDHKTPIVGVDIWYRVGSRYERPGHTGFAHLFEHLMYAGSEHAPERFLTLIDRVGATDRNGVTGWDHTYYFENVPTGALDYALFLESDRMGHLLGAVDQARLDVQKGVVQNEILEDENLPYGRVDRVLWESFWPEGHPYRWMPVGRVEDVERATLDEVHEWFRTYYTPNNAVLVVSGDITPDSARAKVERYFGHIPPGPPLRREALWIHRPATERRQRMEDHVPAARLYRVWGAPQWGAVDGEWLEIAADLLAGGPRSRLHQRLVQRDGLAAGVSAWPGLLQLGGMFVLIATAAPGADLRDVERALDEELTAFLRDGPTEEELARVKQARRASFLRSLERTGSNGGKADLLALGEFYWGGADAYRGQQARLLAATPAQVRDGARRWLEAPSYNLEVHPVQPFAPSHAGVDRSRPPPVAASAAPGFPAVRQATLAGGLRVVVAERPGTPVVTVELKVDAGFATDPPGREGTAALVARALQAGSVRLPEARLADTLAALGAELATAADLDQATVSLSVLRQSLRPALEVMAEVALRPAFAEAEVASLRQAQARQVDAEAASPRETALRLLPALLFPAGHPYRAPHTGTGTAASVEAITRDGLARFHAERYRPANATLVVAGAVTLDALLPELERVFGGWRGGAPPAPALPEAPLPPSRTVYLADRPGSTASELFGAHLLPPAREAGPAADLVNRVLGAVYGSRVNMNLRERRHWTTRARTTILPARGQRLLLASAAVQADRTLDALREFDAELRGIAGDRPPGEAEVDEARAALALALPGRFETTGAIAEGIGELVRAGLPLDHYRTYADRLRAFTTADVARAARELIRADAVVWLVIGDRATLEGPLREMGFGEVRVIDAQGRPAADAR
ncbi:MAG TPA: pitrilysin family protein [Longimicrobium sp.]|nr:pitrilysin family protein [Longimicrobium sp.]